MAENAQVNGRGHAIAEHMRVFPDKSRDMLVVELDRAGFEIFERFVSRITPRNPNEESAVKAAKDRVAGMLMTAALQMKWPSKLLGRD